MSKYFNPRLLNAVIAGTGMRNPVRPHVILGSEDGEFVRGDLMDANAIKEFINQKISDLVNNAPEALDTLKELADAIQENGVADLVTKGQLEAALNTKADEEDLLDYVKKSDMSTMDANGHDYIEIGGIKWATMNVGANSVTDIGLYFQWGDTQGYTASQVGSGSNQKYFGWADYEYGDGTSSPGAAGMAKYNSTDGKTVLDASNDAVTAAWSGSWRMPTTAEFQALGAAVNTEWVSDYQGSGIGGLVCTDKTDSSKTLFFPACGNCFNGSVSSVGHYGGYWSSSLYSSNVQSYILNFSNGFVGWQNYVARYYGFVVRGVLDGGDKYATKAEVEQLQSNIVQSDWNQSDSAAIDYIKNKPNIDLKEDKTVIEAASGATLTAQVGKYYTLSNVGTLAITLPTCTGTKTQSVVFYISTGSTPAVTFTSTHDVYYSDGLEIESGSTYEINALWNGTAWVVISVKIVIQPHDYANDYLTFVAKESGTFTFTPENSNVISYSTDNGTTWTEGNSVSVNSGDKVLWKGTMTPVSSYNDGIGTFSSTGNFDIQGNAMSLLFGDNYKGQTSLTGKDYAFYSLFSYNTKVVNAENLVLPATTLAKSCYEGMFQNCTALTTAPELPATTLENGCCQSMFRGCTNLTTAPELPATTLANSCYLYMFYGCTSLTTAHELPATTLAIQCYKYMFRDCTSLTEAPELPATTLVNYCYEGMFQNCTKLNYIKAMFTTAPGRTYMEDWVSGVSATGTFVKNASATWTTTGVNGIPTGWTVETASAQS